VRWHRQCRWSLVGLCHEEIPSRESFEWYDEREVEEQHQIRTGDPFDGTRSDIPSSDYVEKKKDRGESAGESDEWWRQAIP
jgi:hypothetical protein